MTRLNRSRIKYTPGLCGTSCTFFCRSGFSFLDAVTRPQIYVRTRQVETGSPNSSFSAEDSGHYNLLAAVACAVSAPLAFVSSCSHGPVGRLESHERHHIARPATGRWLQHESGKKAP